MSKDSFITNNKAVHEMRDGTNIEKDFCFFSKGQGTEREISAHTGFKTFLLFLLISLFEEIRGF